MHFASFTNFSSPCGNKAIFCWFYNSGTKKNKKTKMCKEENWKGLLPILGSRSRHNNGVAIGRALCTRQGLHGRARHDQGRAQARTIGDSF